MNNSENIVKLISLYLSGEANKEEISLLNNWISEDIANKNLFAQYKKAWESIDKIKDVPIIDINLEWEKIKEKISTKNKIIKLEKTEKHSFVNILTKIAAIFILALLTTSGTYFLINNLKYQKLIASDTILKQTLPDNSVVTLNYNSTLKYPKKFVKKKRIVTLTGEAYFNVSSDKTKAFIIHAGEIDVEVLGTSFYINANKESDKIEVIVNTGKVAVSNKKDKSINTVLKPGNKCTFSKSTNTLIKSTNKDNNYLSWKTKRMSFKNEKLLDIINTLNKTYNSNIIIKTEAIKNCRVTATFDNQSLDAVLEILKSTLDLEIEKTDTSIILSGEEC
ncbi:MAG: FecR domain-containing protein [Bacteroidales bacterium]|nr:FecR domain-containing protein [Bacteroidales bacterium]